MFENIIDKSIKKTIFLVHFLLFCFIFTFYLLEDSFADNSINTIKNIDNTSENENKILNIISKNDFAIIANVDKIAITKYDLNNFILMMKNSNKIDSKNTKTIGNREYNEYLENYINILKKRVIAENSGINLNKEEKINLWKLFSKNLNTNLSFEEYCKKNDFDKDFVLFFLEGNFLWYKYVETFLKQSITVDNETINSVLEFIMKEEYITRYNLSEIVLYFSNKEQKNVILDRLNNIYKSLDANNFGITAFSVSQASSSKNNGFLGWLYENELNEEINNKLINARQNIIISPFCVGEESGACFIFKVNDIEKKVEISENEKNRIAQFIEKKMLEEKIKNVIDTAKINVVIKY